MGASPAQDAFSPLLLSVQGVNSAAGLGILLSRQVAFPLKKTFHGKDTDRYRICVWYARRDALPLLKKQDEVCVSCSLRTRVELDLVAQFL
jgi:hypothetical protein